MPDFPDDRKSDDNKRAQELYYNSWQTASFIDKKPATVKGDFNISYPYRWNPAFFANIELDEHEVPYKIIDDKKIFDPARIAAFGLHNHAEFLQTGNIRSRYKALQMADWLFDNLREWKEIFHAWIHENTILDWKINSPLVSCQTQGLAISLLLRIAFLNNDAEYEEKARQAVKLFFISKESGGLTTRFKDGTLAFESIPGKEKSLELTGQIFALIGLIEYSAYFDDHSLETVQHSGLSGLKANLNRYFPEKWIVDCLGTNPELVSIDEAMNMIKLIEVLSRTSSDPVFKEIAAEWRKKINLRSNLLYYKWKRFWGKARK